MHESETKKLLMNFLRENTSLEVNDRECWFYAVRRGDPAGKRKAFRADFDAVCLSEHKTGHFCGHDGHSAALCGLALMLAPKNAELSGRALSEDGCREQYTVRSEEEKNLSGDIACGNIYLIFQPGEETGEGALYCRELIRSEKIEEIFGFHNIPGYPEGEILTRKQTFACASCGLEITLEGKNTHAAYPEKGINPAASIAELVRFAEHYPEEHPHRGILFGTTIGISCGSSSYGVAAGSGILRFTLRGEFGAEFDEMMEAVRKKALQAAEQAGLGIRIREIERFPATENTPECTEQVIKAAEQTGLSVRELPEPMRWSEDFGYYLQETAGCFFGVGAGESHAGLHTEEYEFPDGILETVLTLYGRLAELR